MISKRFRKGVSVLCIGLMITTGASGCGGTGSGKNAVPVQSVSSLMGMNMAGANAFGGVVESKTTQAVQKDPDKTVKKCNVKVGDQVKQGDVLFTYDIDELNLSIQSKKLEIEQIQSGLVSAKNQIAELTRERNSASANEKLSYTLEIQELELSNQESEYNLKTKQAELKKLEQSLSDTSVKSEVTGVVQSVNEDAQGGGMYEDDYYGGGDTSNAYITIMETGSFQIKGTATESTIYNLYVDMPVLIQSRSDKTKTWTGRISNIETDSPEAENQDQDYYYDEGDGGSGQSASKYSFYVDLDDTTDILMGQHVYLIPYEEGTYTEGALTLPSCYFTVTEEEGSWCYVASEQGTIEKREVTLSELNPDTDTYDVLSGLTMEDYVADASAEPTEGAKVVMFDSSDHTVHSQTINGDVAESASEGADGEITDEDGEFVEDGEFSEDGEFVEDGEFTEDGAADGEVIDDSAFMDADDENEAVISDEDADQGGN